MDEKVTRTNLRDTASSYHMTFTDRIRARLFLRDKRIIKGNNIIVKSHVEIRLTDNALLEVGDGVILDSYCFLQLTKPQPHLTIGDYVTIGRHCVIAVKGRTSIGNFTQMGPYCQINDQSHSFSRGDLIMNQRAIIKEVLIGKDCWLGSGVRILSGVTIGDGCVIGAGSVVTKSIPPYQIWAGTPARFIHERS